MKPAIDAARRLVLHPIDIAYLRRGDAPSGGALPPLFSLGKDSAVLMMRFSVALAANANVVEAYVVLRRTDAVDDDPAPISLHATRIVEAWEGRSTSWALQPRVVDKRSPATVVEPGGPSLVRLDVRELVRQWPKHDPHDQGIAIVADNESRSGSTFAFISSAPVGPDRGSSSDIGGGLPPARGDGQRTSSSGSSSPAPELEPYLELYVR